MYVHRNDTRFLRSNQVMKARPQRNSLTGISHIQTECQNPSPPSEKEKKIPEHAIANSKKIQRRLICFYVIAANRHF